MAIELMDGATGSKHISSEDWTVFNEATYGTSECVFDWGNRFKLTMSTANAGTLATGAGLVDGKRVWIKSPESITVTSGSQGMKRSDIVGIQYETYTSNGATLERPVVKVIKGTPKATTAADPSIPDKFLALWRVPLDGISVGTPVALFDVMESIKGFRDSVSLAPVTGIKAVKRSGVVSVFFSLAVKKGEEWVKRTTLPSGFRPPMQTVSKAHMTDQPGAFVQIDPSGAVYTSTRSTAGTLYATVTFVVK